MRTAGFTKWDVSIKHVTTRPGPRSYINDNNYWLKPCNPGLVKIRQLAQQQAFFRPIRLRTTPMYRLTSGMPTP